MAQPGQRISELVNGDCLSVLDVTVIAWQISRFLDLLHEVSVSIDRLTIDDMYVKLDKKVIYICCAVTVTKTRYSHFKYFKYVRFFHFYTNNTSKLLTLYTKNTRPVVTFNKDYTQSIHTLTNDTHMVLTH